MFFLLQNGEQVTGNQYFVSLCRTILWDIMALLIIKGINNCVTQCVNIEKSEWTTVLYSCLCGWSYLDILDKLQKRVWRTVYPSLNPWHTVELPELVPLSYHGKSTYYDGLHGFSVSIPRCKDVYFYTFFPHTARLWNTLPWK